MKSKTIDRLDLIRATQEFRLLEEMTRQNNRLHQISQQQEVLAGYRNKLAGAWDAGTIAEAGNLRRASSFFAASRHAAEQIAQLELETSEALRQNQDDLAQSKAYQKSLDEVRQSLARTEERRAGLREERNYCFAQTRSRN